MPCSEELSCVSRATSHYEMETPTTKTTTTVPTNDNIQTKINDIKILILREQKKTNNQSTTITMNNKIINQQQLQ